MRERVEADEVRGAEARALRVRHRRAGDVVDVLGREAVLEHLMDGRHHRVRADAVADEVRRVLAEDDALAERVLREADAVREHALVRLGTGDDLEQLHVADGVEEVQHEEVLLEVRRAALRHLRDAEAGRVRRDDAVLGHDLLELLEERLLGLDLLDDRLDDEVAVLRACRGRPRRCRS